MDLILFEKNNSSSTAESLSFSSTFPPWTLLLCLLAVIAAARFYTYDEPVERDLSTYAVIGHEMRQGRQLYTDLWDHKPPGIYATYALAETLTAYGQQEFFFLGLMAAALTLLGLYRIGSAVGPGGGFWTALFWALICSDMRLEANQPNVEVFANAAMVWALAFLIPPPQGVKNLFLSGVMLAVAFSYKPQAVIFILFFTVALFFLEPTGRRFGLSVRNGLLLLLPTLVVGGGCVLYYYEGGRWKDLYNTLVVYNKYYVGDQWVNLRSGLKLNLLFPNNLYFLIPLFALGLIAFLKWRGPHTKLWLLMAAYGLGTFYFVESTGKSSPHYYQLWLPFSVIAGGWGVALFHQWLGARGWWSRLVLPLVCLFFILQHELPNYQLSPDQWSNAKYGSLFIDARNLAGLLDGLLKPEENFTNFSSDTELYFYTRKNPPSGLIYSYPAMNGPLKDNLMDRLNKDMAAKKPAMIIEDYPALDDYYKRFLDEYDLWKKYPNNNHYALLVRKDSALHDRLRMSGSFQ